MCHFACHIWRQATGSQGQGECFYRHTVAERWFVPGYLVALREGDADGKIRPQVQFILGMFD